MKVHEVLRNKLLLACKNYIYVVHIKGLLGLYCLFRKLCLGCGALMEWNSKFSATCSDWKLLS